MLINIIFKPVYAEIDTLQLTVDSLSATEIRWDNLQGGDEWLQGRQPEKLNNQYQVSIAAGKSISVLQPPESWLRVVSRGDQLSHEKLLVEQSIDGNMFVEKKFYIDKDSRYLLKPVTQTSVIRMINSSKTDITIALYRSRVFITSPQMVYNRQLFIPDTKVIDISIFPDEGLQRYYEVEAMKVSRLKVSGPLRLQVALRLPMQKVYKPETEVHFNIKLNDKSVVSDDLNFMEDYRHTFRIDGKRQSVSDLSQVFINVPAGEHTLSLQGSRSIYVQLSSMGRQFLLDSNVTSGLRKFNDPLSLNDFSSTSLKAELAVFESRVMSLAKDNARPDGALYALSEINRKISSIGYKSWADIQVLKRLQKNIQRRFTVFKSVYLSADDRAEAFRHQWMRYRKNKLQYNLGVPASYLSKKYYSQRLATIAEDGFYLLSTDKMQFNLSSLSIGSDIQLLVLKDKDKDKLSTDTPQKIWLQVDDEIPRQINIRNIPGVESRIRYSVTQKVLDSYACCESLTGDLAIAKGAVKLSDVYSIQLAVKPGVKSVKVWQVDATAPLWFSIQQRMAKRYQLSESQYLFALSEDDLFAEFVAGLNLYQQHLSDKHKSSDEQYTEMQNHWQPLYKQLVFNYQNRLTNVKAFLFRHTSDLFNERIDKLQAVALKYEKAQQWTVAMQVWSKLIHNSDISTQIIALQKMVKGLQHTGQHALAKQLQLSIVFSKIDPSVDEVSRTKIQALVARQFRLLIDEYKNQANDDAIMALQSAFFVHQPGLSNIRSLAQVMVNQGRWMNGLQLLLMLPQQSQPLESVLLASLHTGWGSVFNKILSDNSFTESAVNKWRGLEAMFTHDFATAKKYFSRVDTDLGRDSEVMDWLELLNESIEIRESLASTNRNDRLRSIHRWQDQQKKLNALVLTDWRSDNVSIVSHAGQIELFNASTNVKLKQYLSRKKQPLQLLVAGPANFKLQIRPLHHIVNNQVNALNRSYSISNRQTGKKQLYLINQNLPAKNWQIMHLPAKPEKPLVVDNSIYLAGQRIEHDLELGPGLHQLEISADEELLIRLQRQYYVTPVSALPQLTADNMMLLMQDDGLEGNADYIDAVKQTTPTPAEQLNRISLKLETNSSDIDKLIAQSEKIYADSGNAQALTSVINRIRRYSRWELLNTVQHSDGFWIQQFTDYNPESPNSLIYKSLLDPETTDVIDELLGNGSKQVVSVFYPYDGDIKLSLRSLAPFFMLTKTVKVSIQVDDNEPQYQSVSAETEVVSIALLSGRHTIKIEVLQAPLHHRLMLALDDRNNEAVDNTQYRRYQISTKHQPLIYKLHGSAWLRIDKLLRKKDNQTDVVESNYRYYPEGDHQLELVENSSEGVSYYRVFTRKKSQQRYKDVSVSWLDKSATKGETDVMLYADNVVAFNQPENIKKPSVIIDAWKLGRQQDGTTSLLLTSVDQNLILDELSISSDKYIETELAYRKHNPLSKFIHGRWFYLAALARVRQEGNNSIGVKSRLRGQFNTIPVDWTIDGRAYAQQIASSTESSVQLQLRLSQTRWLGRQFYHLPKVDLFARWLSASSDAAEINVDRDVYSNYKKDHPSGFRLSETLVYRPYQDVEFYTGLTLIGNANWTDLDQYRSRIGARVQWGAARWDINARNLQFMQDENRQAATSRSVVQARILLEKWLYPRYRFELAAAIDHDVDSGDDTLRVQFSVHQSEGRGYLDYSPAETLFRDLRQSKLKAGLNNEFY